MMATIQSIVNQSMRGDIDVNTMRNNITSRLDALGRSHDILRNRDFSSANIKDVVERAVEPFNVSGRFRLPVLTSYCLIKAAIPWRYRCTNSRPTR